MAFAAAKAPKSLLGFHRLLAPSAAVRVSPLCLGGMGFGDAWTDLMGECSKDTAFEILDYFHSQGGNFIDTANNYQRGQSEKWIGEWMASRGVRDQIVLATKYVTAWRGGENGPSENENIVNTGGTGAKSLRTSLNQSLKNFQTDYVDLLYIHWWDFSSSIEELMHTLDNAVTSGKVLYLGASDTPAWVVAKANQYARDHGLRQFSVYQGRWNASVRDFERDIMPMAVSEKMALAPWAPLGGGAFKTEEEYTNQGKNDGARGKSPQTDKVKKVVRALDSVAKKHDTKLAAVALAYLMHKTPYVFPIIGGRKLHHLKENIEALGLKLTDDDMKEIEGAGEFDLGFPHTMIGRNGYASTLNGIGGAVDWVEDLRPIPARSLEEKIAEYRKLQNPLG